jgi:hypothetical protein
MEKWLDKHNHKMELMRTLLSLIAALTGMLVFARIFGLIT